MIKINCPICHGLKISNKNYNLSICRECDHVFQSDLKISIKYDPKYAHQYDNRPHQEMSHIRWVFIQKFLSLPLGSKILDIGYGNGSFLKYAQKNGMNIFGIDVHGENFGIPEVNYNSDLIFDLVCFFDSLEHFENFNIIKNLKAKRIIISTPDPVDFLLEEPYLWRHYKPGEHLHYFSKKSLGTLMKNMGFTNEIACGFPEDELRGKLIIKNKNYNNIVTTIFSL